MENRNLTKQTNSIHIKNEEVTLWPYELSVRLKPSLGGWGMGH